MEEDRSDELLLGTEQVDKFQAWATKNAKKAGEWYKDASADQAGIGDDMLRLLGGGAKNVATVAGAVYEAPVLKQGFQALDALSYYGGKVGGAAARAAGVDPRIGGAIGNVAGEVLTGFGAKAGLKYGAKAAKATKNYAGAFYGLASGTAMGTGAHGATGIVRTARAKGPISRIGVYPQSIVRDFPNNIPLQKAADDFLRSSMTYARKSMQGLPGGSGDINQPLKGFGRFIDDDGNAWLVRGTKGMSSIEDLSFKLARESDRKASAALRHFREGVNIPQVRTALGNQAHRLDEFLTQVAGDLTAVEGKRSAFNKRLRELGIPKGSADASLGHIKALDNLGIHMAQNIRFETLSRNAARQAVADPPDRLLRALNIPVTWDDAVKQFLDPESVLRHPAHILTPKDRYSILYEGANFDRVLSARKSLNQAAGVEWLPSTKRFAARHKLNIKKTKPTQFPDNIQRHIKRSQEIGITEPQWKSGSIDYTWRPQSGTGQIDIPPQSAKGFKGLRDEFFEQIEKLPSGSVWELNPKFKDEQRRRIYASLFGKDARITRNPDPTLGWVLTVP